VTEAEILAIIEITDGRLRRGAKSHRRSLGHNADHTGVIVLAKQFALRPFQHSIRSISPRLPKPTPLRGR